MSQEKVDRRKYEKKNRKQLERKRKIRTTVKCVTAALIVGTIIGVPLGIRIYREQPKFVGDKTVGAFIENYIDEHYASEISGLGQSTEEQEDSTTEDELTKAIEDVTDGDVKKVDADDMDEVLGTDSSEEASSEEASDDKDTED